MIVKTPMIGQDTIDDLKQQGWPYILGARMRAQKEVRAQVLSDRGRFRAVYEARQKSTDPAPLKVKEVWIQDRRYVVCINEEEVEHDRIVGYLRDRLAAPGKGKSGVTGRSDV